MPRQPYLKFHKEGMHYTIGASTLSQRPEHASLIGQCIAMWTEIELQMSLSLGALMKSNSEAAVALFLALRTSSAQRNVLNEIVGILLKDKEKEAFEALMVIYRRNELERNALAHGSFGYSNDMLDAVVWCNIQDHAHFLIDVYMNEYQGTPLSDPHKKLRETMYVYKLKDLQKILDDFTELQRVSEILCK